MEISVAGSSKQSNSVKLEGIPSTMSSQNKCFICSANVRTRVRRRTILEVWIAKGILVPENNRCCTDHLDGEVLKQEALNQIEIAQNHSNVTPQHISKLFKLFRDASMKKELPIDFSDPRRYTDLEYKLLLGVKREDFEILLGHCEGMRKSTNRTVRNSLAIFLMKLRLNVSQKVLAFLFGIRSQSIVSKTIFAVMKCLHARFVPLYHGFSHLTREQIKENHMRKFYSSVLGLDESAIIMILDGTYLYTQKASDFKLQRQTYSMQKKRNLFKPMMTVLPSGYILEASGLFFGDSQNNDANILKKMMEMQNSILSILEKKDCLILDRGFRDVIEDMNKKDITTYMPQLLVKGQSQFTTTEANKSRQVMIMH